MRVYLFHLFLSFLFSISFAQSFAQTITSVVPDIGYQGQQQLEVNISGTNLNFTQSSSVLIWLKQGNDSIAADAADMTSANTAVSYFNFSPSASLGFYDLYCLNQISSQTAILQNGFQILTTPPIPDAPTLITPTHNETLSSTIISFDWSAPQYAQRYELIVDDNSAFTSPIIYQPNLQTNNYTNSNIFFNNTQYFWKVRAKNSAGVWGNWSTINQFTVQATPQIIAINPNQGYKGQTNLPVTISGVNTNFTQSSSTNQFVLTQQSYAITALTSGSNNPYSIDASVNIPGNAPLGYYNLHNYSLQDTLTLLNAFYVHQSNQFSGTVFIDANNNQVYDIGEVPYSQGIISISSGNQYSLTQSNGYFHGYAPPGNFTFSLSNPPQHYTLTPAQHSATFSGIGQTDTDNNFALHPSPDIHHLSINLTNNTPARPGLTDRLTLTITNYGTVTESGTITLTIPPALSVISSSNPSYTIASNTITWNYTALQPFAVQQITIDLDVPVSVQLGTILNFTAQVTSGTTPSESPAYLEQTVVNSYDPNIKEVLPAEGLTPQQAADGQYLQYTIHFQNTGTAEAINIRILDTLNPFLDITTFQVLAASHPWQANILENRLTEFRFDNINLPDSNTNETLSHGFITYHIKPTPAFGNTSGNQIENTAHIYFDFNSPIVTNTTVTSIIMGIEEANQSKLNLQITPNPFNAQTNIYYTIPQSDFVSIKLYNSNGQLVKTILNKQQHSGNHKLNINLDALPAGVYFVALNSNSVSDSKKLLLVK